MDLTPRQRQINHLLEATLEINQMSEAALDEPDTRPVEMAMLTTLNAILTGIALLVELEAERGSN
jgi:hypothetical protein